MSVHREKIRTPRGLIDCPEKGCPRRDSNGFTRKDNLLDHRRRVHNRNIPKRNHASGGQSVRKQEIDHGTGGLDKWCVSVGLDVQNESVYCFFHANLQLSYVGYTSWNKTKECLHGQYIRSAGLLSVNSRSVCPCHVSRGCEVFSAKLKAQRNSPCVPMGVSIHASSGRGRSQYRCREPVVLQFWHVHISSRFRYLK